MYKNNFIAKSIRLALIGSVTSATLAVPSVYSAEQSADKVERIQVTGSRIQRAEFESASNIASFDAADIANSGATSIDEFLKFIPSTSGLQLGATTNNGNDGAKKIDLRGLDFNRTLVLINSKRTIGDLGNDGAVDLNQVPMSMVKRIEVLKDGASTIYGTDAIAGVVNIILYNDFEGVRIGGSYSAGMNEWDAQQQSLSILMGTASDKGRITVGLEYNNQDELKQGERDWAHDALYPNAVYDDDRNVTGFKPVASGSSNSRKITGLSEAARLKIVEAGGPNSTNYILDAETGLARAFESSDVYNYAPVNALITPNKRYQFALNGSYDIADSTTAYVEALYTHRSSHKRLAPDASFGSADTQYVPATNPYNPFGNNAANPWGVSGEKVIINRRFTESGGRLYSQSASTYRFIAGFNGELTDNIYWDLSYTHAYNEQIDDTNNLHRKDKWAIAVDPTQCAENEKCAAAGVLDPFADYGSISAAQMQFLMANSLKDYRYGEMNHIVATVSGDSLGLELPGGDIGWAIGYENRFEKGEVIPDEFLSEGLTTGGATDAMSGSYSVNEVYAEAVFPVLDSLNFEAAIRYSEYNNSSGSSTNYKIAGDWKPLDSLKLRGGFSTGFRAPNISELNQNQETDFPQVGNKCEFLDLRDDLTATQRVNCQQPGVNTEEYGYAYQVTYVTSSPEKPLEPEESKNYNLGVVFNVPGFDQLNFSVDYWRIELTNVIGSTPYQLLYEACLDSENYSAQVCQAFDGGKAINGDGDPADAEYFFGNVGELSVSGLDIVADYSTDVDWGFINNFAAKFSGTYYISREETWVDFDLTREMVGKAYTLEVYPEFKMTTSFSISGEDWSANWDIRYVDETVDVLVPASITDDNIADAMFYNDINASYMWSNVKVSVGIANLFDEDAPRYHSGFNANTAPGTYDTIGRRFFTSVQVDF